MNHPTEKALRRRRSFAVPAHLFLVIKAVLILPSEAFFQNLIPSMPAMTLKSTGTAAAGPLLKELDKLIADTNGGVDDSNVEQVKETMIRISNSRQSDQRQSLPGEWELVYTTEKEINFFKTSWPFAKVSSSVCS